MSFSEPRSLPWDSKLELRCLKCRARLCSRVGLISTDLRGNAARVDLGMLGEWGNPGTPLDALPWLDFNRQAQVQVLPGTAGSWQRCLDPLLCLLMGSGTKARTHKRVPADKCTPISRALFRMENYSIDTQRTRKKHHFSIALNTTKWLCL